MRGEIIFSYYTTLLLNWQTFFCHPVNFREYTDYVLMNFANFVIFPENICPHQAEFVKKLAIPFHNTDCCPLFGAQNRLQQKYEHFVKSIDIVREAGIIC